MTVVPPGPEGHVFVRGDYGSEYASDVVELIERMNCSKGCRRGAPGSDEPGGSCDILCRILAQEPVPEIDPRPDGPVCTVREPVDGGGA